MDLTAIRRRLETDLTETDHTLATIRERLAVGQRDDGGEISLLDQHPADAASDTEARELDVTQQRMLEARMARTREALERIERGTYGTCQACGKRIPEERLEILPDTPYCVADAAREEKK